MPTIPASLSQSAGFATLSSEQVEMILCDAFVWSVRETTDGYWYIPANWSMNAPREAWMDLVPQEGISPADLRLVDDRLSQVFDTEYIRRCEIGGTKDVSYCMFGTEVHYTRRLWRGDLLCLPVDAFPEKNRPAEHIYLGEKNLKLYFRHVDGQEELVIGGISCVVISNTHQPDYVCDSKYLEYALCPQWMTNHYPGWRNVLALATALDIQEDTLQRLMFPVTGSKPAETVPTLGEVGLA